jgi:predicted GIY-YIG superfamily endonuclease
MAWSQWWTFSEDFVKSDRDEPGVYLFANTAGTVIYVGGSEAIRRRLREHLNDRDTCIARNAVKYCLDYRSDYLRQEQAVYDEIVRTTRHAPLCNAVRPSGA